MAILKRLKRGDENELERKLRLEKVVDSKHLRLAVETEKERRAKLENDAATKRLSLAMETDEERKARLEKMVATKRFRLAMETDKESKARLEKMVATTQLRLARSQRKKEDKKGMDLIWIDIGFFKISRNKLGRPVMGTIFLVKSHYQFFVYLGCNFVLHRSLTIVKLKKRKIVLRRSKLEVFPLSQFRHLKLAKKHKVY